MSDKNQELAEWSILRTVQLQSVATWMLQDIFKRLNALEKKIVAEVVNTDPTETQNPKVQKVKLAALLDAIRELIKSAYVELLDRMEEDFDELADIIDDKNREKIFAVFNLSPRATKLAGITGFSFMGATLEDWLSRQAGDLQKKYEDTLSHGVDNNEPMESLTRRVKGFAGAMADKQVVIPRPMDSAFRNAETLTRTGVDGLAFEVDDRIADKITTTKTGWQSIAVVDSRTTQICLAYAWKIWDADLNPIGHSLTFLPVPRHWGCRSSIVLIILDEDPAGEFSFVDWMNQIPKKEQDRIFGKKNMALYRAGKITESALIRQQEQVLSLDDYRDAIDPRTPKD